MGDSAERGFSEAGYVLPVEKGSTMNDTVNLLDVVALTVDVPEHGLSRGEIGTIVECYPDGEAFEIEFVAQDGYTYALTALLREQLMVLRQKRTPSDAEAVSAGI